MLIVRVARGQRGRREEFAQAHLDAAVAARDRRRCRSASARAWRRPPARRGVPPVAQPVARARAAGSRAAQRSECIEIEAHVPSIAQDQKWLSRRIGQPLRRDRPPAPAVRRNFVSSSPGAAVPARARAPGVASRGDRLLQPDLGRGLRRQAPAGPRAPGARCRAARSRTARPPAARPAPSSGIASSSNRNPMLSAKESAPSSAICALASVRGVSSGAKQASCPVRCERSTSMQRGAAGSRVLQRDRRARGSDREILDRDHRRVERRRAARAAP